MKYTVEIGKKAQKFIKKLPVPDRERVLRAIYKLPDGTDILKLKGSETLYRLRIGNYRVIYTVDDGKLIVIVIDAGNRGQIYNNY